VDREQALDVALGQIERNFGKGAVMKMNDRAAVSIGAVSTGSLSLDLALGIGGLPRGRIIEVFGPESSGKTTLVYHVIAEAQRRGGICAFIDAEHSMDPAYAKNIGVNIDDLLVSQPDTGEQGLEIAELLIRSGALDVVAVDSVAALTPKAEIEGEMGDSHVGLQARLMSQALRKLAGTLNRTDTICLFTNQLREKIGVMFGSPETTPGGRALKFYSSVRLDIRRIETLKEGVEAIGNRVRVKVVKNKVAPPFKQAEFDIIYGAGISWEGTVLETGLERKVVQKSGSYFSFDDERLGQGRQNATAFLREHPDLTQQILGRIQTDIGPEQVVSARLLPAADQADAAKAATNGKAPEEIMEEVAVEVAAARYCGRESPRSGRSGAGTSPSTSMASAGAPCRRRLPPRPASSSGVSSTARRYASCGARCADPRHWRPPRRRCGIATCPRHA
jgi:recombination protein RecA